MVTVARMKRILSIAVGAIMIAAPLAAQAPEYETREIAENVYMFRHRAHNAVFVVTGAGVVVFDPINNDAARILKGEIEGVTSQPIAAIVYSHHHADHVSGAAQLATDVPIIAHANAYAALLAEPNADVAMPNHTFTDRMTMQVGDVPIHLIYVGKNHSDNSIVALLPDQGIIFAVDFVSNDRVGYRDLPGFYLPDLFESLEELQQLDYRMAVFGHGPPGTKADVYEQINYWTDVRQAAEAAVAEGVPEEEFVAGVDMPEYADWGGYENWFKMNARTVYKFYAEERSG